MLERRLDGRAVVAVKEPIRVQDERDVAVPAAAGRAAGPAVDRRRDAAAVQQQDRLAAVAGHGVEPRDEGRGQRVARLAAQVDDLDGRQGGGDAAAELEPLERRPALRARRGGAVDGDRLLERGPLRGDRSRVIPRVGLLLVGGVVLLVDADRRRGRGTGAKTAERAPTTTRASPRATRSRSSRRSASPSEEWRTATVSPKRAVKRASVCGVSAISGTRTIAPRPRASASSHARR